MHQMQIPIYFLYKNAALKQKNFVRLQATHEKAVRTIHTVVI